MEGCSEYLSAAGLQSAVQRNTRDRMKKEASERKRSILYLIQAYLRENNLTTSAECLSTEAQLIGDYEVCDNIDLDTIVQEYQSYYYAKFGKAAKLAKPAKQAAATIGRTGQQPKRRSSFPATNPSSPPTTSMKTQPEIQQPEFQFEIRRLGCNGVPETTPIARSLCDLDQYTGEWREMADLILKEIVPDTLGIAWGDCVGLEQSVERLKEAVVYPLQYPKLFSGLVAPWKGVLLYGPPGTGKTLLSRAVACEGRTTFFNLTSSGFVNKWRGESEKLLRVLFDVARFYAPSTVFVDELDALACGQSDFLHDASRRFRSELLVQLDGVLREDDRVFVLATTNRPWDLDAAVLRRFEKRILVDLPGERARADIFGYYFAANENRFKEEELLRMGRLSVDFSGSDIKSVCKEACMRRLRQTISRMDLKGGRGDGPLLEGPSVEDVIEALGNVKPVTRSKLQQKYLKWHEEFGCL